MMTIIRNILFYIFIVTFTVISVKYNIDKPIILVLHSYNVDYSWVRDVNEGLKKVLDAKSSYTVRWYYMDTKNNPSEAHKQRAGLVARRMIDDIKPDIIIAVDDDAQEYAAKYYVDNPDIKIIFCGVNDSADAYGYDVAKNVTGILERIPLQGVRDTINVIIKDTPSLKNARIMHLSDDSSTVQADDEFIESFDKNWENLQLQPSVLVRSFREWQKAINLAPQHADFVIVSNYRKVYDDTGKLVPPKDVMNWTVQNSKVPIIGVNGFVVEDGGKFAVATSPFEQGEVVAKMALRIIKEKISPKEIPITQTKQFIIYLRGEFDMPLPSIYEAFARAANKYWEEPKKQ